VASGKGSADPLASLHKGRGVRGNLARALDKPTFDNWLIDKSDSELVRRAKVIYRLDAVFHHLADAECRLALPFIYNTPADLEMADTDLHEREKLIQRRHPDKKLSSRKLLRMRTDFADQNRATLNRVAPPFNEDVLVKIVERERRFAGELRQADRPRKFAELVRKAYDAPMSVPIAAFLELPVLVPRTHDDQLIVGKTSRHGLWVCVFSDERQLSAHPVARRQERHSVAAGKELVREVLGKWHTVGIVVDPPAVRAPGDGASYPTALHMPADLLATLV
jgi:hypothetical protein